MNTVSIVASNAFACMKMKVYVYLYDAVLLCVACYVCISVKGIIQCVRKVTVHCTPPDFYMWGTAKSAVYHYGPRTPNELETAITALIRNSSQSDLQKVFANKTKQSFVSVPGV
jgi:hypothetical protein